MHLLHTIKPPIIQRNSHKHVMAELFGAVTLQLTKSEHMRFLQRVLISLLVTSIQLTYPNSLKIASICLHTDYTLIFIPLIKMLVRVLV